MDFHDFHEDVFRENGVPYGGLQQVPDLVLDTYFERRLEALISLKESLRRHWGWKEPRTCLFLSHHHKFLSDPVYLFIHRPCMSVVKSLWSRKSKMSDLPSVPDPEDKNHREIIDKFIASWVQYNERMIDFSRILGPERFRFTSVYDLMATSGETVEWLNEYGFGLENVPFSSIFDSTKFSNSELRFEISEEVQLKIAYVDDFYETQVCGQEKAEKMMTLLSEKNRFIQRLEGKISGSEEEYERLKKIAEELRKQVTLLKTDGDEKTKAIEAKEKIIESAKDWQKDWKKRMFRRWRP